MKPHNYGVLSMEDVPFMELILRLVASRFGKVSMLEIGVANGGTTKGCREFCLRNGWEFTWHGCDTEIGRPSFDLGEWGTFHCGNFHDPAIHQAVPAEFNFLFQDGDHCFDCTVKDFQLFSTKVIQFGFVAIHDTNPDPTWQNHWPQCRPDRFIETRRAIAELNLLPCQRADFTFLGEQSRGTTQGMALWQKLA